MAWNDKPTDAQLGIIFKWIRWEMPTAEASNAVNWLEKNATRKQVSEEMNRLKELKDTKKINRASCFDSEIWANYMGGAK